MMLRLSMFLASTALFAAPLAAGPADLRAFDTAISSADQTAWLKDLSSAPNHVGSPHDKANAETMLALFKAWGWDARIETFSVLYPTPISTTLELVAPARETLGGQESAVEGDGTSLKLDGALPPYVAYQGDGDVTAAIVYVNYGMPADYDALARRGIDVRGKIVLARYGGGWRGLKPKLAQEHGALGCLIYSDPADDGYAVFDAYPRGGGRPPQGVQRGSVQDMTTYPGDPLTPGVGATAGAKRLTRETATTILKIPALPISYADATKILAGLEGAVVPKAARGALPLAYHWGGTDAVKVHLAVRSDWSMKTLYDVIATLKGRSLPDQWVIRGNHRDAWVFGASDPLSGTVAMLSEAKALGQAHKAGWSPERTIVYASWDGEEPGLLGSTEWAETHEAELAKKAVLYVNTDNNGRGTLNVDGSQELQPLVDAAAAGVTDPETGVPLPDRQRADILAGDGAGRAAPEEIAAARAGGGIPLAAMGSGSDYSAFLQHIGVPSLNLGFAGEDATAGAYHSIYDSFHHFTTFDDPGLRYGAALSKVTGRIVLRAADAGPVPVRYGAFASAVTRYVGEVKTLATDQREKDRRIAALVRDGAYKAAADPTDPVGPPADKGITPLIDTLALESAAERLTRSAAAADAAVARYPMLDAARQTRIAMLTADVDRLQLTPQGLPGRPWYRNLVTAPGRFTGYGAKTLPGVREAIEERRWDDATRYAGLTAAMLTAYADRLDAIATVAK